MFITLLKFTDDRSRAAELADSHQEWIRRGFADGVFLMVGSLQPAQGGAIVVHDTTLDDLQRRVAEDPFVAAGVVTADILEVTPTQTGERLAFLRRPAGSRADAAD
jgi:uncharacterized protein YciI